MKENQTGRYADGMKETLDFIKESKQIDLLNEGTVSLRVPRVCRVIRLKPGGTHYRIKRHKDTQAGRSEDGDEDGDEASRRCNDCVVKTPPTHPAQRPADRND